MTTATAPTSKKEQFFQMDHAMPVDISGQPVQTKAKEFSTGSIGWNMTGKIHVRLPNGVVVKCQVSGNIVIVGSKDW